MVTLPLLHEGDLDLVDSYAVSPEEGMSLAVVNAFLAAEIDVFGKSTKLADWVNPDVFEALQWADDRPIYLCTLIWNHQVVVTSQEIRIYAAPTFDFREDGSQVRKGN